MRKIPKSTRVQNRQLQQGKPELLVP
jgi:hypothetical protein